MMIRIIRAFAILILLILPPVIADDASDNSIEASSDEQLALVSSAGSGTADDPYVIEDLSMQDDPENSISISNTDAYLLIKDCSFGAAIRSEDSFSGLDASAKDPEISQVEDTSGSDDSRLDGGTGIQGAGDMQTENPAGRDESTINPGIGIVGARNVQIENCTFHNGRLFRISGSQNIQVRKNTGRNLFFEGVRDSLIEDCASDRIMIKGLLYSFPGDKLIDLSSISDKASDAYESAGPWNEFEYYDTPDLLKDITMNSQRCLIKDCAWVKEIDLIDAEDCVIENCRIDGGGLLMMSARNATVRNSTVANATVSMCWSPKMNLENITLLNSAISLDGFGPEDYSVGFRNSTIDGKKIHYYKDQQELELENLSAGYIWLENCSRSKVKGVNALGIFVIKSEGVTIEDSQIDRDGIHLAFSEDCVISNNTLKNQGSGEGIVQHAVCNNNTLSCNIVLKREAANNKAFSIGYKR